MLNYRNTEIKKIYLAGQMSGLPDWGDAAFRKAAAKLREDGFEVFNPAETENGYKDHPREYYMKIDLNQVINHADAVVVLPNWKQSPGAKAEVLTAREVNKPVFNFEPYLTEVSEQVTVIVSDYVVRY